MEPFTLYGPSEHMPDPPARRSLSAYSPPSPPSCLVFSWLSPRLRGVRGNRPRREPLPKTSPKPAPAGLRWDNLDGRLISVARLGRNRSEPGGPGTTMRRTGAGWSGFAGLLLACATLAAAGAPSYLPKTWQTSDGLPVNIVVAVARAADGYLCLGLSSDRVQGVLDAPDEGLLAGTAPRTAGRASSDARRASSTQSQTDGSRAPSER